LCHIRQIAYFECGGAECLNCSFKLAGNIRKFSTIMAESVIQSLFFLVILIFSVIIHEISHGFAALFLGDKTAQYAGRLTLNPIPHIDLFGSIILPVMLFLFQSPILFGWAKPVPYNPYNLKNQKWGPALVGAAGPGSNILIALLLGLAVRFLPSAPIFSPEFLSTFISTLSIIVFLNLALAIFNLIPIPPLDGSKVLFSVLPYQWSFVREFLERNGFFILLIFIFFFSRFLLPIILFLFSLITGGARLF